MLAQLILDLSHFRAVIQKIFCHQLCLLIELLANDPFQNVFRVFHKSNLPFCITSNGCSISLPWNALYRSSSGWTATAVSPSIVSKRVVATIKASLVPLIMYLNSQSTPTSTSRVSGWLGLHILQPSSSHSCYNNIHHLPPTSSPIWRCLMLEDSFFSLKTNWWGNTPCARILRLWKLMGKLHHHLDCCLHTAPSISPYSKYF